MLIVLNEKTVTKFIDLKSYFLRGQVSRPWNWHIFSFNKLENKFFGGYSANLFKNGVGCSIEGTFG